MTPEEQRELAVTIGRALDEQQKKYGFADADRLQLLFALMWGEGQKLGMSGRALAEHAVKQIREIDRVVTAVRRARGGA